MKDRIERIRQIIEMDSLWVAFLIFSLSAVALLIIVWFLLFSGISATADFVYNQF